MSTENTHSSEAQELIDRWRKRADNVNLPRCVVDALDDCATELEMHLLRQESPTTTPPLAGEGGELLCDMARFLRGFLSNVWDTSIAEALVSRFDRLQKAPPTLAPSQGTAVTDEAIEIAYRSYIADASNWRGSQHHFYAGYRDALASPAVRDEVAAPEWLREFIEKYRLAPLDWDTLASWFRSAHEERLRLREEIAELRTHQKVAAAGDET